MSDAHNNLSPLLKAVVVNDDITQLSMLSGLLRKTGLDPITFQSAEAALTTMGQEPVPALIVTDLYMPGIDGWRFCRLLRSSEYVRFNHVPILVVSAIFSGDEPSRITSDLGANAFLPMPVDGRLFIEQAQSLLKGEAPPDILKVLVIEDYLSISAKLVKAFRAHGYLVEAAFSYHEALDLIEENTYHVAVLAYHLPDGRGDGLLKLLQEKSPDCVCIMTVADAQSELALTWMKMGAAAYLQKPFEPEYLIAQCERARREHAMLRIQDLLEMRTRQLRESELYLRTILQTTKDGFWMLDSSGRVLDANDAYCKMSGYSLAELKQLSIPDMDAGEDPAETAARIDRVIRNGSELFETYHHKKDGSIFEVEISVTYQAQEGGRFICFCRDITARKQAEQKYQMLFREMLDGFALHEIIVDAQGTPVDYRFLSVNPAFERMTGLKEADIRGRTVLEVMPNTEPSWINTYGRVALTGEPAFFENYSREIDKYFEVTAFQSARNQFACIFKDITDRKRTEIDLKAAYTRLEALWSITSLAEADIKTISDHILKTITRMTDSAYGFYGFMNEDESAMTIHAWSGEAMKDCSLVDKPQHFLINEAGVWAEAIRKRKPLILNHYDQDHAAKKGLPMGHVLLHNLLVVPHLSHGKITSVAAVANRLNDYDQDDIIQINTLLTSVEAIVESKRTEEALRKSEERYHLIDEASQDLIYSYDRQSRFTHANSSLCRLLGLKPEQIVGKTHEELGFSPEQCQEWTRLHLQVYQTNKTVIAETITPIQGAPSQYFEVVLNPIHDESGNIIGIAGMTRDINARKKAEAQIAEQLEELRRWHNVTLGRENRIIELKKEVNQLLAEAGQPPRYTSVLE